jgi:ABC-2 type transport system ATP-binding protein
VVFSTHNMDQAEQVCDYVCIIARGQKVLDGSLDDVQRQYRGHRYRVEFDSLTPAVLAMMQGTDPALGGAVRAGVGWELELPDREGVQRALTRLASADAPLARFQRIRPSLHQIFVEKVGEAQVAGRRPEVARA